MYKWSNPHEWLRDYIRREEDVRRLHALAITLSMKLGADQIQDLFESVMDEDGYFEEEE